MVGETEKENLRVASVQEITVERRSVNRKLALERLEDVGDCENQ